MTEIGGFENNEEELEYWIRKLGLVENTRETCPGCDNTVIFYTSLYDANVVVEYCSTCNILIPRNTGIQPKERDTCPYCAEVVKSSILDEYPEPYVKCNEPDCENKMHLSCRNNEKNGTEEWYCKKHKKELVNKGTGPPQKAEDYIKNGIKRLLVFYPCIFTPALACYMLEGSNGNMTLELRDNLKVYEYGILRRFGYFKIRQVLNELIFNGKVKVDDNNRLEWIQN